MGTNGYDPASRVRRGRPIDPYVDEALRTATIEIISKSGWRGATIERIAERAGVARTTIYRRHGSVYGVLLMLIAERYATDLAPDTGALHSDLIAMMRSAAISWREPVHVDFVYAVMAAQRENAALGEAYRALFQVRRKDSMLMITRAQDRGELRPDADGSLLLDLLSGWFVQRTAAYGTGPCDEDIVHVVDAVLPAFTVAAA